MQMIGNCCCSERKQESWKTAEVDSSGLPSQCHRRMICDKERTA